MFNKEVKPNMKTFLISLIVGLVVISLDTTGALAEGDTAIAKAPVVTVNIDPDIKAKAQKAVDQGLHYLREHQANDGSWSKSVGITALALRAFLESYRKYGEEDGAFITRPVSYILAKVRKDGAITESIQNVDYNTAVAIKALEATNNPAYKGTIQKAQNFLKHSQLDEGEGYKPDHKYYGGIGYGGDERPDLSNQYIALEALRGKSADPNDPTWKKALTFVSRCQNNSETNDQSWAKNDGGFTYMPGYSPNGEANSYGSMTHAGLMSLLLAGVDKNDPRVQAAYNWIRENYTVKENPGAQGNQGLFYYYNVFAKSMSAFGEAEIKDSKGQTHNWRNDLASQLISLQGEDGSWANSNPRWWENNKDMVTASTVIALSYLVK